MAMIKRNCHRECFYCDAPFTRHEHDHAPVPEMSGGTETVPACPPCHTLKDRMSMTGWPVRMVWDSISELLASGAGLGGSEWPSCWDDLSREARLMWAKMAKLHSVCGDAWQSAAPGVPTGPMADMSSDDILHLSHAYGAGRY